VVTAACLALGTELFNVYVILYTLVAEDDGAHVPTPEAYAVCWTT